MSFIASRSLSRLMGFSLIQRSTLALSTDIGVSPPSKKKKQPPEKRINLIENSSLTVMTLESAAKLASRRGLQLNEVEKPLNWMLSGNRPAFELLAPVNKISIKKLDAVKQRGFKGIKHAIFSVKIQEHDLATKIKQVAKWLSTGYVVEVAIDVSEQKNTIAARIEEAVSDIAKLPGTVKRQSQTIFRIEYEPKREAEEKQLDGTSTELKK